MVKYMFILAQILISIDDQREAPVWQRLVNKFFATEKFTRFMCTFMFFRVPY